MIQAGPKTDFKNAKTVLTARCTVGHAPEAHRRRRVPHHGAESVAGSLLALAPRPVASRLVPCLALLPLVECDAAQAPPIPAHPLPGAVGVGGHEGGARLQLPAPGRHAQLASFVLIPQAIGVAWTA